MKLVDVVARFIKRGIEEHAEDTPGVSARELYEFFKPMIKSDNPITKLDVIHTLKIGDVLKPMGPCVLMMRSTPLFLTSTTRLVVYMMSNVTDTIHVTGKQDEDQHSNFKVLLLVYHGVKDVLDLTDLASVGMLGCYIPVLHLLDACRVVDNVADQL